MSKSYVKRLAIQQQPNLFPKKECEYPHCMCYVDIRGTITPRAPDSLMIGYSTITMCAQNACTWPSCDCTCPSPADKFKSCMVTPKMLGIAADKFDGLSLPKWKGVN